MCGTTGPSPSIAGVTEREFAPPDGPLHETRTEAFSDRFLNALNEAAAITMMSVGQRCSGQAFGIKPSGTKDECDEWGTRRRLGANQEIAMSSFGVCSYH